MKSSLALTLAALALTVGATAQDKPAKEVTLIASGGIRAAIEKMIPAFEEKSGYKVQATFASALVTKKQVAEGAAFDVPIVQPPYPEVIASGNVIAGSARPLATVSVGIAVRKGMSKPDISSVDAVRKSLLAAKSVALPRPAGAAGVSFMETLNKLGIADQMKATLKPAQSGAAAMAMVAKGEAEIGLTFLSEMEDPGIDVVGALPKAISPPTPLVGFLSAHAKNPEGAKKLLDYLASKDAAAVYKSVRMQPGR